MAGPGARLGRQGPGLGKNVKGRRGKRGRNFGMLFNYTCKFEKSRKDEAQETGLSFALPIF